MVSHVAISSCSLVVSRLPYTTFDVIVLKEDRILRTPMACRHDDGMSFRMSTVVISTDPCEDASREIPWPSSIATLRMVFETPHEKRIGRALPTTARSAVTIAALVLPLNIINEELPIARNIAIAFPTNPTS